MSSKILFAMCFALHSFHASMAACVYGPYKCPKLTNWLKNHTNQKKGSKKMRSKKIRTRATARSDGGPNHSAIGTSSPPPTEGGSDNINH